MKKRIKLLPIGLVSLFALTALPFAVNYVNADDNKCYVDFYNNYQREEFELSSGFVGKGNNLLYKRVEVSVGSLVSKPVDPVHTSYDFNGWFKEEACENEWNFLTDTVSKSTRLYASWTRGQEIVIPEPSYTPPSTVLDESAAEDYELTSVMGFAPSILDIVEVSNSAIERLKLQQDNVLPLLEYKVKASKSISATYTVGNPDGKITITCNGVNRELTVKNKTLSYPALGSETYETKAKKFEENIANENENYHVMMAGSSSMEFWETYERDMDPVVCYNHGIGGTKVAEWTNNLNKRLVYPYKPKMVVYYVGINNIKDGESVNDTTTALQALFDETHSYLPNSRIQYVLLNKCPLVKNRFNDVDEVNNFVRNYQTTHDWFDVIDPNPDFMKETGEPNAAYYRTDNIHLTYYGYVIWAKHIKASVLAGLEKMK